MTTPIGIDLGTTYSLIARLDKDGRPSLIPQAGGKPSLASAVGWDDGEIVLGEEARELEKQGSKEVYTFFKRAMGNPDWEIEMGGETYSPQRLSSLILKHLKDSAGAYLDEPVTQAVITVPAYFMNAQREATWEAARLAGIEPLSIINEPTAAALAYGLRPAAQGGIALVYDLGGGTFDVSIVKIGEDDLRVIATGGDHELGGKNWDDKLSSEISTQFQSQFGVDPLDDESNDLLPRTEDLKRALSERQSASIRIMANGRTGTFEVSRDQFENLSRDLVETTRALSEQVLNEANLSWQQVDYVVPVGGSTRLPMIQRLLLEMSGKEPVSGVNPDEAVALGAAIKAALDLERLTPSAPEMFIAGRRNISDVMSHSLGLIATDEKNTRYLNSRIILKNQPIPAQETRAYRLPLSQRRENKLEVFVTQGEMDDPQACAYLDLYAFTGIPNSGAKHADIDVTFAYDHNGMVQASAIDSASQTPLTLTREPLPDDIPERFLGSPQDPRAAREATIYIVVDVSGSMSGTPLAEAKNAAQAFLNECELGAIKIGIMAVSDRTQALTDPTDNAGKVNTAIDALQVGLTGGGNSAHPFDDLYGRLINAKGERYAVVLADGVWSNQSGAVQQARRCHQAEINIVGVGFGGADEKFLRDISNMDLGGFTDLSKLTETFTTIAQEIGGGGAPVVATGGLLRRFGR